ncbi:MAG: SRPBCC domain-containing protein [Flavobacteriales bacterium]|jgi:uncharacterized protein YndB with AHSA1/START domain|nr:SRPBCC domain-containing protein [Flavobacteriales bacterium]
MDQSLKVNKSIEIEAAPEAVWDALINPQKIEQYLFGTQTTSDWNVGSTIRFEGEFNGQKYQDKGNVLEVIENEYIRYNYWSGFSGLPDTPENYCAVIYKLEKQTNNRVLFTWKQIGFSNEENKCHTENSLGQILQQIKELVEKE